MNAVPEQELLPSAFIEVQWYDVRRGGQWFFEVPQILIIFGVLFVAILLDPGDRLYGTHQQLGLPPCMSRVVLGIPCPSCGLTTCFALMAHGRVFRAFQAHYFGPILFAGMVGYLALLISFLIRKQRIKMIWPNWMPLTLLFGGMGLYLLCWIVRVVQYI